MLAPPKIVLLRGDLGAGKTTLLQRVYEQTDLPLVPSISATTRRPRPGEQDGVDYHFLSREEFAREKTRKGANVLTADEHR